MREKTKLGNLKLFLIFAGPAAVLFLCVVVIPFLYGLVLTFTNWNGISDGAGFVAFQNYVTAFKDTAFWHSLLLTLGYVAASVILINLVAFFLAYLLTSGIKGQNFLRSAFFTPNLIGGIVLGFIWQFVFNNALTSFGSGHRIRFALQLLAERSHHGVLGAGGGDGLAVFGLYDDHLCGRIYQRVPRPA